MVLMKRFLLLATLAAASVTAADLGTVHTVYLLPMSKGLDQYLANRLTNDGILQVVTDPAKADAVFTDRIGESFEQKMDELLPPPEPPKPEKPAEEKKDDKKKATDARGDVSPMDEPMNKLARAGSMNSFSKGKGTVFLVNAKTKQVLWSAYEPPRDTSAKQLDKTAGVLVTRLKKDFGK